MNDRVLQAVEEAEDRQARRVALMARKLGGNASVARGGPLLDLVAENRFIGYYDALKAFATYGAATVEAYRPLEAKQPELRADVVAPLIATMARLRGVERQQHDHVFAGAMMGVQADVGLAASIIGYADALRVALGLPADPYTAIETSKEASS